MQVKYFYNFGRYIAKDTGQSYFLTVDEDEAKNFYQGEFIIQVDRYTGTGTVIFNLVGSTDGKTWTEISSVKITTIGYYRTLVKEATWNRDFKHLALQWNVPAGECEFQSGFLLTCISPQKSTQVYNFPQTRGDIIEQALIIGNRVGDDTIREFLATQLNMMLQRIYRDYAFDFLRTRMSFILEEGSQEVLLPENFNNRGDGLWLDKRLLIYLPPTDLKKVDTKARPTSYTIDADGLRYKIIFNTKADKPYDCKIHYYFLPEVLYKDEEIVYFPRPDLLINFLYSIILKYENNPQYVNEEIKARMELDDYIRRHSKIRIGRISFSPLFFNLKK